MTADFFMKLVLVTLLISGAPIVLLLTRDTLSCGPHCSANAMAERAPWLLESFDSNRCNPILTGAKWEDGVPTLIPDAPYASNTYSVPWDSRPCIKKNVGEITGECRLSFSNRDQGDTRASLTDCRNDFCNEEYEAPAFVGAADRCMADEMPLLQKTLGVLLQQLLTASTMFSIVFVASIGICECNDRATQMVAPAKMPVRCCQQTSN